MKRTHKKCFSLLFITILIISLCSCSRNSNVGNQEKEPQNTNTEILRIGTAIYQPYFFKEDDGSYAGIDKEISTEVCKRLHYTPVYVETSWSEQQGLLKNGSIDCIWGRFSMNGREDLYLWAGPYLYSPVSICVRADSDIKTLNDLNGRKVAVLINSMAEAYLLADSSLPDIQIRSYNDVDHLFASFNKGYTDAVIGHQTTLKQYTKDSSDLYNYLDDPLFIAKLGVAFSKDDTSGRVQKISQTLKEMNKDGTITTIAKKYGLNSSRVVEVTDNDS